MQELPEKTRIEIDQGITVSKLPSKLPVSAPVPPKTKQLKLEKKKSQNVGDMFRRQERKSTKYKQIKREEIDESVLKDLPLELQNEILREIREQEARVSKKQKMEGPSKDDSGKQERTKEEKQEKEEERKLVGSVFVVDEDWKYSLKEWMMTIELDENVMYVYSELFWQFIRQSIEEETNMEKACSFLRMLRKHCERSKSRLWKELFDGVLDLTQTLMMSKYSGTFDTAKFFH